ncbi:MAG: DUF1565 domain-containing protein [Cyanobacteria bacterium J06639_1]
MNRRQVVTSPRTEVQSLRHSLWLKPVGVALLALGVAQVMLPVPARAQENRGRNEPAIVAQANTSTVLHVDALNGSDTQGSGSASAPYKTIASAVERANAGTVIQLAPGTYSEESGETFPIKLKRGITLQGDEGNLGESHLISGGGIFISPTMARQNVAVLGANDVEIRGITLQNQQPRGYALWLESASTNVTNSTFAGSKHDGIFMSGSSNARVESSRFFQNGANGISVLGTSAPTISNSLFQETGYGIAVGQKAQPAIANNRIVQNRSGVVISADARPVLRSNIISDNTENGLVAITNALPDLGRQDDPGNNVFENNGKVDIHNATRGNVLAASGNQISGGIEGEVDLTGAVAAIDAGNLNAAPGSIAEPLPQPPVAEAAPSEEPLASDPAPVEDPVAVADPTAKPTEVRTEASAETNSGTNFVRPTQSEGISSGEGQAIEFSANDSAERQEPLLDITTLIPVGQPRSQSALPATSDPAPVETAPATEAATPSNDTVAALSPKQFRVLVTPRPGETLSQLQRVVPQASTTERNGQQLFVVGVYDSRTDTQAILDRLTEEGYIATAEVVGSEAS